MLTPLGLVHGPQLLLGDAEPYGQLSGLRRGEPGGQSDHRPHQQDLPARRPHTLH
ncbi:hypothetical protein [Streptomyces sp. NPDC048825]|uniref:hypothetical protein n=1 Tax=Streptomyces sp. NPDC048825 TaxID=3365592 RepID=UPI0037144D71